MCCLRSTVGCGEHRADTTDLARDGRWHLSACLWGARTHGREVTPSAEKGNAICRKRQSDRVGPYRDLRDSAQDCRHSRHFSPCPNAPERLSLLAVALSAVSPPWPSHVAGGALTFSKDGPVGGCMAMGTRRMQLSCSCRYSRPILNTHCAPQIDKPRYFTSRTRRYSSYRSPCRSAVPANRHSHERPHDTSSRLLPGQPIIRQRWTGPIFRPPPGAPYPID